MAHPETPLGEGVPSGPTRTVSRNPVDPANLLDPIPLFNDLRENAPVFWSDHVQGWVLTRHADVHNGFRDPRLSANRVLVLEHQLRLIGMPPEEVPEYLDFTSRQMTVKDGAEHLRLRRPISLSFSPQDLDRVMPAIHRSVNLLLDRVQEQGHMDVVEALAYQLAPRVIADFLGVPPDSQDRFQNVSEPIIKFGSPAAGVDLKHTAYLANEGTKALCSFISSLFEERRVSPREDALSQFLAQQQEGRMSPEELLANAGIILIAGHLTTTDQLSNAVHDLLTHPEQMRKLQEDPTLMKSALEEILRFRPAVPYLHRIATEDFQLHGKTIRKGDIVFLCMAAANRDPSVFPDADVFDITRDYIHQKHITFAFGPHHCLGAGLARRELTIALELLMQRMPGLHLDETRPPSVKCESMLTRGFNSLHVRW